MPKEGKHSREVVALVEEFIVHLEEIPDGCPECFPYDIIDELKQEHISVLN